MVRKGEVEGRGRGRGRWARGRGGYARCADQEEQEEKEADEKERPSSTSFVVDQREMRIARLGWPLGRPSCGPKPGERSWPGLSLSLALFLSLLVRSPLFLLRFAAFFLLLPRNGRRVFILSVLCSLLSRPLLLSPRRPSHSRSLSLSSSFFFVGRKWFMAIPERRFRRGSCAEDRPLLLYPALGLSRWSCRFIRHASSLRPSLRSRRHVAVFLRGIPFFMHAIASFALLTRRNGISVFYRG